MVMTTEATTGRVAVITGASSGIGEATARALVAAAQRVEQFYDATSISADDIAQIIAFAVSRPRSVSINEILVRPTAQSL